MGGAGEDEGVEGEGGETLLFVEGRGETQRNAVEVEGDAGVHWDGGEAVEIGRGGSRRGSRDLN